MKVLQNLHRRLTPLVVSVTFICSLKVIVFENFQPEVDVTDTYEDYLIESDNGSKDYESDETIGSTWSADRVESSETEEDLMELDGLYNVTGCPVDYLGLAEYAASKLCANQTPEVCNSLSCRSLLTGTGNDLQYGIARKLMSTRSSDLVPDSYFIDATKDCEAFRTDRGYHMTPLSSEEAEFPLAFNLIVHTNAEQVERQLRALYRPQNRFCIHIDAKSSSEFMAAMIGISGCFDNIFIASRLERVHWGGYSRLQADINCMQNHMINSSSRGVQWKYLINTAGLAFPLKTIGEMVKILKIYNGANDIEGIYGSRVIKSRFEKEWQEDTNLGTLKTTGKKNPKPPHNIFIVRGSAYGVFSRDFVRFILEDGKAIDFLKWSRRTWSPDELFWSSLHHTYSNPQLHTPGGFSGYPSDKPWLAVYANWADIESKCRGKRVRSVCVFGVGDLPDLTQRKELFANKFFTSFEPLTLDCLSAWIRQKEVCPPLFDADYYRALPFVKNAL